MKGNLNKFHRGGGHLVRKFIKILIHTATITLSFDLSAANTALTVSPSTKNAKLDPYLTILEDVSGQKTVDEITQPLEYEKFTKPLSKNPTFPLVRSTFWGKFTLKNNDLMPIHMVLQNDDFYANHISLFIKDELGEFKEYKSGAFIPWQDWPIQYRVPAFNITVPPGESELYLRLQAESVQFNLSISEKSHFSHDSRVYMTLIGLFIGALVSMLLYNLFLFSTTRKSLYLLYSSYVFFFIWFF